MFVFINVLIRFFDVILIVKQLKGCIYSETAWLAALPSQWLAVTVFSNTAAIEFFSDGGWGVGTRLAGSVSHLK